MRRGYELWVRVRIVEGVNPIREKLKTWKMQFQLRTTMRGTLAEKQRADTTYTAMMSTLPLNKQQDPDIVVTELAKLTFASF